jgi:hypothetical protein
MQIKMGTAAVKVLGCLMLLIGSSVAFGQETRASLGGQVTDPTGALISNATVVVTAGDTGVVQTASTSKTGQWRVQFLNPGMYHFEVSAAGFQAIKYTSVELQVGDEKTIDSQLQLATQSQAVTVDAAETPLIDTTAAVSGTVITAEEMAEVPSLSNAPTMLLGITPGATVGSGSSGGVYLWSNIGLSQSSVNGTGYNQGTSYQAINYTLDGGSDTNNLGEVAYEPPMDSVGEFKVVANAYDASIGRNLGTTITLQSKTGTRSVHGDLYEINQNNFLNANSYQFDAQHPPTPQGPIHTNYYGGAVGGPIWIPKLYDGRKKGLFFFFSWSGIRNQAPVDAGFVNVPTAAERTGDFSQSYTYSAGVKYPINIYDPNTVVCTNSPTCTAFARTQFSSNMIPSARLDPVAVAMMALLPLPDAPPLTTSGNDVNNYVRHEVQNDKMVTYALRLDKAWNNANHSYINVRQNNWSELSLDPFGPAFYLNNYYQTRLNRGVTLDHSVALNKDMLLDLSYNIIRYLPDTFNGSAGINPTTLGYSSNYASQMQLPSIPLIENVFTGVEKSGLGTDNAGTATFDTNQDMNGSIVQTWKNHTFRYGLEYMIQQEALNSLGLAGGFFTFGTNWNSVSPVGTVPVGSGSALASFMEGLPTGGNIPISATGFWSQHFLASYFQDDWRVNKNLTLNIGLRWDFQRPVTERFNRFAYRFDPNFVVAGVTSAAQANYAAVLAGSSTNTGTALLQAQRPNVSGFVAKGGLLYAGVNGTPNTVENAVYKYYQPRLGFAYHLFENTVVRGGLGRFVQADFNTASGNQTGYSQTTTFTPTTNNYESAPTISMENPYPNGIEPATGNSQGELTNIGSVGSYTDPNLGRVYVDALSASIQQQVKSFLFEVGFTFDKTHGIGMGWEVNDPAASAWHAAYDPEFSATGVPVTTLPANTPVTNPFYQVAGIETSLSAYTAKTQTAYTFLRPNPLLGNLTDNRGTGQVRYYAMNTRVERRFKKGFSVLQSFSWSKSLTADGFIGPQVAGAYIFHTLSGNDMKFHYVLTPVYELPFGRGKQFLNHANRLVDELAGGWEFTGIYQFQSGTPLNLPTNSSFFEGGDPSLGKNKTPGQWFNTAMFKPFPTSSTTAATLAAYPSWTGVAGLPGASYAPASGTACTAVCNGVFNDFTSYRVTYNQQYFGDIRNPYVTTFTLGVRKNFKIYEGVSFQLGMDAFNALNHPQFGGIDVTPTDTYFGAISGGPSSNWVQVNSPRTIQLRGRLTF